MRELSNSVGRLFDFQSSLFEFDSSMIASESSLNRTVQFFMVC